MIIGGGGAGLAAALSALENGAQKVIVIEKRPVLGGNAAKSSHLFAVESHVQKAANISTTRDEIFGWSLDWHHFDRVNPGVLRSFIDKSSDTIQWLSDMGLEFTLRDVEHLAKDENGEVRQGTMNQALLVMIDKSKNCGAQFLLDTAGERILRGTNGEVTGIVVISEGKETVIKTRSIIISTGGFLGSKEYLNRYFSLEKDDPFFTNALPYTGDGIKLAEEAGAGVETFAGVMAPGFRSFDRAPAGAGADSGTIWVNKKGKRFINEDAPRNFAVNTVLQQPGKCFYSIYDENIVQDVMQRKVEQPGGGVPYGITDVDTRTLKERLQEQDEIGECVKIADSLDDIAQWIGADPKTMKETIDEYNSLCAKGHDEVFVKDKKHLAPISVPPFYAIKSIAFLIDTMGPVRINERMEVLDKQYDPIPGLYAAGMIASGWMGSDYTHGGYALGWVINSGRTAGENAAEYVRGK